MTELPLILNPTAGRGGALKRLPVVAEVLAEHGIEVKTVFSRRRGDIEVRVREAIDSGCRRLLVAGGDGTVHETVNGILSGSEGCEFGLLPVGTGNDFAKAMGIPLDHEAAARQLGARLSQGTAARRVDAGRCNDRYFANGAGIGIDARVAMFASGIRLPIGNLVYVIGVIRCLIEGIATPSMTVSRDGETLWSGPATLVNVANGDWLGGQFNIAPEADPGDGEFDLVVADAVTRRRIVQLVPKLMRGEHIGAPEVHSHRVTAIEVHGSEPLIAHLDGELLPRSREFRIECLPGALALL